MHAHVHTHVHTHVYAHAHTHVYAHVHTQVPAAFDDTLATLRFAEVVSKITTHPERNDNMNARDLDAEEPLVQPDNVVDAAVRTKPHTHGHAYRAITILYSPNYIAITM